MDNSKHYHALRQSILAQLDMERIELIRANALLSRDIDILKEREQQLTALVSEREGEEGKSNALINNSIQLLMSLDSKYESLSSTIDIGELLQLIQHELQQQ
jgi:hypothetical protein